MTGLAISLEKIYHTLLSLNAGLCPLSTYFEIMTIVTLFNKNNTQKIFFATSNRFSETNDFNISSYNIVTDIRLHYPLRVIVLQTQNWILTQQMTK